MVAVAREIDLVRTDLELPTTPRDADEAARLAEHWGLESPMKRLLETLQA